MVASGGSGKTIGMLGPGDRNRPSFSRYLIQLYRLDPMFRGFVDFSAIGALILYFLWPNPDASKKATQNSQQSAVSSNSVPSTSTQATPSGPASDVSISYPIEVTNPSLKSFVVIDIDESVFSSSVSGDVPKLQAAARAFRAEQFAQVSELLKTASPEDRNVNFMRGIAAINSSDPETVRSGTKLLKTAKEAGQAQAALMLGRQLVISVDRTTQSTAEGQKLIEDAAANGDRVAERLAGIAYMSGEFGVIDTAKGRSLFEQAAQAGDLSGMFFYSFTLGWGIRGPTNQVAAVDLLRRSAAGGLTTAQETLAQWLIAKYDRKLIDDPREAVEWLDRAWQVGRSIEAVKTLALFLGDSRHPEPWISKTRVFDLASLCSGLNSPWCQAENGWVYENAIGTKYDPLRAAAHYQVAIQLGDGDVTTSLQHLMKRFSDADKSAAIKYSEMIYADLRPTPIAWHMQYVGLDTVPRPWMSSPEPPAVARANDASIPMTNPSNLPFLNGITVQSLKIKNENLTGELKRASDTEWRLEYIYKNIPGDHPISYKQTAANSTTIDLQNSVDKTYLQIVLRDQMVLYWSGNKSAFYANVVGGMSRSSDGHETKWLMKIPDNISDNIKEAFSIYLSSRNNKAFAMRNDNNSSYRSYEYASEQEARTAALKGCGGQCRIYAVNNFLLDLDPTSNLPSEMKDIFKQYLLWPDEKAFAVNGTKYGWRRGAETLDAAKTDALKACGDNCQLYAVGNIIMK